MTTTTFLQDLYNSYSAGFMSYAEYTFRHGKARGEYITFSRFRLEGGTREQYDALVAGY